MAARFQAPRGTFDILPADAAARARVEETARELFDRAGYARIETPAFEETELFARGVGEATDIVRKEMFTFEDMGGRSVTLRPEGTAPIARAYLEHGMHRLAQPVRLWYMGPFFRHERPQAGRFRQFNQIGAEAIGSESPLVDAEQIMLLDELLRTLGVPELRLRLGSLGSPRTRADYRSELTAYLREREGAQSGVGGGGRYDLLLEELGGSPTPASGWAAGVERILLALDAEAEESPRDVFVAAADEQRERALSLVAELRRAGLRAELDLAGRGIKGQMKQADRVGAARAVILDAEGPAKLRDMHSGEQREIEVARVVEELTGR